MASRINLIIDNLSIVWILTKIKNAKTNWKRKFNKYATMSKIQWVFDTQVPVGLLDRSKSRIARGQKMRSFKIAG